MTIIATSDLKTALRIPAAVTFHDAAISAFVSGANSYVLGALGQTALATVGIQEYPEIYGPGQGSIVLERRPVGSVVAITNDGTLMVAGTDYRVDLEKGIVRLKSTASFSGVRDGVEVYYTAGYTSGTLPFELKHAATVLAVAMFNRSKDQGLLERDANGYSVKVDPMDVPPEARMILARYEDKHHS